MILQKTVSTVRSERKHTYRVSTTKSGARWWSSSTRPHLGKAPPPVHTSVKPPPCWSLHLGKAPPPVHTLVKSPPCCPRRCGFNTDRNGCMSTYLSLGFCLFVCFLGDWIWHVLNCFAMCGEILSWSLWVCNNDHVTLWRWELHVNIRVFLLPLHLSGRDNRGRD